MTTLFTIEVTDDNPFNTGWVGYVLGWARPDPERDPFGADGWDMAENTPSLRGVRVVFTPENENFKVNLKAPTPPKPREVTVPEGESRALDGNR